MTNTVQLICSDSHALTPFRHLPSKEEFLSSEKERIFHKIFEHSMKIAKFEMQHLIPSDRVLQARSRRLYHVLPILTGPYLVGHTSFILERTKNSYMIGDSKMGIEIYAPTQQANGKRLFMLSEGSPFRSLLGIKQLQTLYTHSTDCLDPIGKMPILIFSHGFGVDPCEYRPLLENLASHGYVILNLNHPSSSSYAPFSKEALDLILFEHMSFEAFIKEIDKLTLVQAENIRYVVDKIRKEEILKDLGHSHQIVLAGHSLGGASSVLVSSNDPLIKGCVNLDGGLSIDRKTKTQGLQIPLLTILSDHKTYPKDIPDNILEHMKKTDEDLETFHQNSLHSSKLQIDDILHLDFCSFQFLLWLMGENELERTLKAHQITSQEMLNFMHSIFSQN
jgi:dienelactone hydrolase